VSFWWKCLLREVNVLLVSCVGTIVVKGAIHSNTVGLYNNRKCLRVRYRIRCWKRYRYGTVFPAQPEWDMVIFGKLATEKRELSVMPEISARNGYPGRYPLPGYPVRTRVPGNFYYPVADHSTVSFRLRIWCNSQRISQVYWKFTCKLQLYNCTTHHRLAYYGVAYTAYLLITQDCAWPRHLARLPERLILHVVFK